METKIIHVKEGEMKIVPIVWFGGEDRKVKTRVLLDKRGSSAKVLCLFFAKSGTFTLETEVVHDAPDTFSRTLVKGVLDGTAIADYEGKVVIKKGSKNADADCALSGDPSRSVKIVSTSTPTRSPVRDVTPSVKCRSSLLKSIASSSKILRC